MKRLCKDIDITDIGLIQRAAYECLQKKFYRDDTARYLAEVSGESPETIKARIRAEGKASVYPIVDRACELIRQSLLDETVTLPPIWYREKIDGSSGKIRTIGIQNVKQQIYDYIAVEGLKPLLRRVGEYQCASIKGRGTLYGKNAIWQWTRNRKMRYFCKMDVRKCFESIDHGRMLDFLGRRIKNPKLMYLLRTLLASFRQGLDIGSYLSQHLCNLYMSILYHYIMEELYKTRRGKRNRLVQHCLIYMDDILILGTDRRNLKMAARQIVQKAAEMGLEIKPGYQVCDIRQTGIDMMGYKICHDRCIIRGRIFIRARRAFLKARKRMTVKMAKKCVSYYGYLKHTNSGRIIQRWKVRRTIRLCKEVVRNAGKICNAAAAG